MKLKQLESYLGDIEQFQDPKVELEQYATGTHIAAHMMYMVEGTYGDIEGRRVADFGTGSGILGIAACLLDAAYVVGLDVDPDALELAAQNCNHFEVVEMDLVQCDVAAVPWREAVGIRAPLVDTVVMNPPFGTRRKGADMDFLRVALKVAGTAVYSLHKTSTRNHIQRAAVKDYGARTAEVLCQLRYDLPAQYKFHKRKDMDIEVDLWRFEPPNSDSLVCLPRSLH
eukprot:jgi/Mesen1/2647/ME000166S01772